MHFAALPIFVSVLLGIGGGVRLYRTVMIDEIYSDYVRTARAKGVEQPPGALHARAEERADPGDHQHRHRAARPDPGALLLERIFQIPGLGNFMVEALNNYDRTVVMGMTFVLRSSTAC